MKTKLTKDQKRVQASCMGKAKCITLLQQTNAHDILKRHGLRPIAMRVGTDLLSFDEVEYRRAIREGQRQKNDTYCMTFYDAHDCAEMTGSPAPNWTSWSRLMLDVDSNGDSTDYIVLSAESDEHEPIRQAIMDKGRKPHGTPILSGTAVVFYLAAQKRWPDTALYFHHVEPIKIKLEKLNIVVLGLDPTGKRSLPPDDASDLDVDDLLAANNMPPVADPQPVAAAPAPTDPVPEPEVSPEEPEADEPEPEDGTLSVAPPTSLSPEELAAMDEDEFAAYQQAVLDRLTKAQALRKQRQANAIWKSGEMVAREQWPGKPYDLRVTVRYSDGTEQTFTNDAYSQPKAEPSDPVTPEFHVQ